MKRGDTDVLVLIVPSQGRHAVRTRGTNGWRNPQVTDLCLKQREELMLDTALAFVRMKGENVKSCSGSVLQRSCLDASRDTAML